VLAFFKIVEPKSNPLGTSKDAQRNILKLFLKPPPALSLKAFNHGGK
jgi:hypothetical protein